MPLRKEDLMESQAWHFLVSLSQTLPTPTASLS